MTEVPETCFGSADAFHLSEGNDVDRILAEARRRQGAIASMPMESIVASLADVAALWRTGGRYHTAFLDSAPQRSVGWSREMIELGLDAFAAGLSADVARSRARTQLGSWECLDGFVANGHSRCRAHPVGVVLHVVSDGIFFGPAQALLAALLTKNVSLVKTASDDAGFLRFLLRSLREAAPALAAAVAPFSWKGGEGEVEARLAAAVDAIFIAAGADVVRRYRSIADPAIRLIELGPRISVAVVSAAGTGSLRLRDLARDVALWEQYACTNAQCVFVEGAANAEGLAQGLFAALAELSKELPEGPATLDERIEVARLRDLAAFDALRGPTRAHFDEHSLATVVFEPQARLSPSPLRRCVRVMPFASPDELTRALAPGRGLLQSVALAVAREEESVYRDALIAAGARRLCRAGAMNTPSPWGAHDGLMELQHLVRWVEDEAGT